ncbi:Anaerobic sulfite reductase subunit B [subsurface metagenome]
MKNPYMPELALITEIKEETPEVKTFTVSLRDGKPFKSKPGQFIELSVFGCGEFPASISAILDEKAYFQTTVRRMGKVTQKFMDLPVNSTIGIRGPFGSGFPVEEMEGSNVLLIAGGVGLTSIKYLARYLLENRDSYGNLKLLYGARTPSDLLFRDTFPLSNRGEVEKKGLEVLLTVDEADEEWKGNIGVVTELFGKTDLNPDNTLVAICGPSIMMKFATARLIDIGFDENQIFLSLERRMQCGIGMCGHCMIGQKRVCLDGPVFAYKDVKDTLERLF